MEWTMVVPIRYLNSGRASTISRWWHHIWCVLQRLTTHNTRFHELGLPRSVLPIVVRILRGQEVVVTHARRFLRRCPLVWRSERSPFCCRLSWHALGRVVFIGLPRFGVLPWLLNQEPSLLRMHQHPIQHRLLTPHEHLALAIRWAKLLPNRRPESMAKILSRSLMRYDMPTMRRTNKCSTRPRTHAPFD